MKTYWTVGCPIDADWERVIGVWLMSRYPRLSFIDIEFKDRRLCLTVEVNKTIINHQVQVLKNACLYPGCKQERRSKDWCNEHMNCLRDRESCTITRCLVAKQLSIDLTSKGEKELLSLIQCSSIQMMAEYKDEVRLIELRQVVPHYRYEIGPVDQLTRRALDTLPYSLGHKQFMDGYNFVAYGEETSLFIEFDSHRDCPASFEFNLIWYGDDETDERSQHSLDITFKLMK